MKKVVVVYDNLLHKPKLHNLTSFENANKYEYEDIFITEYNDIYNVFLDSTPDIYIINVNFNDYEIIEKIEKTAKFAKKCLKLIVITSDSKLRDILYKSKIRNEFLAQMLGRNVD